MEEEEAPTARVAAAAEDHQVETQPPSMMIKSSCTLESFVCGFIESHFSYTYHLDANTLQHITLDKSQVEGPPTPLAPDLTVSLAENTAKFFLDFNHSLSPRKKKFP